MKVEFRINANKELEYFEKFVNICGVSKLKKESLELLKLDKKSAVNKLKKDYKQKDFIEFIKNLKKEWKKIEKEYFNKVEKMTGFKWKHKRYICYISLNVPGLSDIFNDNLDTIILSNILSVNIMKYVLAHELFHLHYFHICKKEKMTIEAASTAITESIPILFMIIDNRLNHLWPDVNINRVRGSYPEVDKILDKLINIYQTEKRFIPLINKSIEAMKNAD